MFQILNWICLICICFLVLEIMIYFCKDAINLYNGVENKSTRKLVKTKVSTSVYDYQNKIAK